MLRMSAWFVSACLLVVLFFIVRGILREYEIETIRWENGDVRLKGSLYVPKEPGKHPCVVIIHGSGNLSRYGRSGEIFRQHAQRLASNGVAVAIYDKRGCGESTGDWKTASLFDLADDTRGLLDKLKDQPRIDSERIGLMGCSQGGWVGLIAASRWPDKVKFLITVSGSVRSPAEQGHFILENNLSSKGFTSEQIQEALELDRMVANVYRTDNGWDEARQAIREAKSKDWFQAAQIGLQNKQSWNWKWYRDLPFDLDPNPMFSALSIPVLSVHGADDPLVSSGAGSKEFKNFAENGKDFEVIVYPKAAHILQLPGNKSWKAPDVYWSDLMKWFQRIEIIEPHATGDDGR